MKLGKALVSCLSSAGVLAPAAVTAHLVSSSSVSPLQVQASVEDLVLGQKPSFAVGDVKPEAAPAAPAAPESKESSSGVEPSVSSESVASSSEPQPQPQPQP